MHHEPTPGWTHTTAGLERTFTFRNFSETMSFVNAVAHLANVADHHPDLAVKYASVTVRLFTHDAGGVTERDHTLAARIDALPLFT